MPGSFHSLSSHLSSVTLQFDAMHLALSLDTDAVVKWTTHNVLHVSWSKNNRFLSTRDETDIYSRTVWFNFFLHVPRDVIQCNYVILPPKLFYIPNKFHSYWVSGLCPSSGILNTRERNVSETGSISILRWQVKAHTQLGLLERANHNH
jgi:hypothetical protein